MLPFLKETSLIDFLFERFVEFSLLEELWKLFIIDGLFSFWSFSASWFFFDSLFFDLVFETVCGLFFSESVVFSFGSCSMLSWFFCTSLVLLLWLPLSLLFCGLFWLLPRLLDCELTRSLRFLAPSFGGLRDCHLRMLRAWMLSSSEV